MTVPRALPVPRASAPPAREPGGADCWPPADPSWTPRRSDVPALLGLVMGAGPDGERARAALGRLDPPPLAEVLAALDTALGAGGSVAGAPPLLRLLGRWGTRTEARDALIAALGHPEPRVRRASAQALGRARPEGSGAALARCFQAEADPSARRALVEALGKVGGPDAAGALAAEAAADRRGVRVERDVELARRLEVARLRVARGTSVARSPREAGDDLPAGTRAVYRCRAGLETLLAAELGGDAAVVAPGRVAVTLRGALATLARPRLALSAGLALGAAELGGRDPAAVLAEVLASPGARVLFALWGGRPARFRLAWTEGKHRAATHRVAAALTPLAGELLNDPRGSDWEVLVRVGRARLHVELEPRGLLERRFGWRQAEVPGASHPTLAAALARVGAPRPGDRVWDPFVGSALELCECFLLTSSSPAGARDLELWGTDLDPAALEAAQRNLGAAAGERGAGARATLLLGDSAAVALPGRPTLVVTNPPWGGRVGDEATAAAAVRGVLLRVGRELAADGRVAWIARDPRRSDAWVAEAGLVVAERWPLDLGGIHGELQRLTRPAAGSERAGRRRRG